MPIAAWAVTAARASGTTVAPRRWRARIPRLPAGAESCLITSAQIECEAGAVVEGANAALAQHYVGVAFGQNILGR